MSPLRAFGLILFLFGFLSCAFVSVRQVDSAGLDWWTIDWPWYGATLVIGAAGVVILRRTEKRAGLHSDIIDEDLQRIRRSLIHVIEEIDEMNRARHATWVYDVHQLIDARLAEAIFTLVESRESVAHRFGLQPYAEMMTCFALGERNINRAWSASADGYVDEVWSCMERAEKLMSDTLELFERITTTEDFDTLE